MVNGADINQINCDHRTPLHAAVFYRRMNIVKRLIKQKAKLEAKDRHYKTPLFYAKANGMKDIVEILIKAGADDNSEGFNDCAPSLATVGLIHQTNK